MTKHQMPIAADKSKLYGHVASLPCQHAGCACGGRGESQVSHSNQGRDGHGMGLKSYPWRVAAICVLGHVAIDSGKHMSKQERREAWNDAHRSTIGELFRLGLVRPV